MVLENLISLTAGMCAYNFEIQLFLLGQFVLHLSLLSVRNSRKYHPIMALAFPGLIFFASGCLNMVIVASAILGVVFIGISRFLNFSYISRAK